MVRILVIGIGGMVGAILRYQLSGIVQQVSGSVMVPYGTLAMDLIGCFPIGFLSQLAEARGAFSAETRALVSIGFLGSFTPFPPLGTKP